MTKIQKKSQHRTHLRFQQRVLFAFFTVIWWRKNNINRNTYIWGSGSSSWCLSIQSTASSTEVTWSKAFRQIGSSYPKLSRVLNNQITNNQDFWNKFLFIIINQKNSYSKSSWFMPDFPILKTLIFLDQSGFSKHCARHVRLVSLCFADLTLFESPEI